MMTYYGLKYINTFKKGKKLKNMCLYDLFLFIHKLTFSEQGWQFLELNYLRHHVGTQVCCRKGRQ